MAQEVATPGAPASAARADGRYSGAFVVLACVFVTCLVTANIIAVKIFALPGNWFVPAGIVIFPLSYLFGDVLTEVYGYAAARRVIWLGFACNLLAVVAITAGSALPAAPFWRDQGLSGQALTDLPGAPFVIDNSPPDGSLGILLTFIGTAGSGAGLTWSDAVLDDPAVRPAAFLDALTTLFGPKAARPVLYLEKDWVHEPWINGCVSARVPGLLTQYTNAVSEPVGLIHWAGTETATVFEGYMDGAVRAGERAANEVGAVL